MSRPVRTWETASMLALLLAACSPAIIPGPPVRPSNEIDWLGQFGPLSDQVRAQRGIPILGTIAYYHSLVGLTSEAQPRALIAVRRPGNSTSNSELWAADQPGGRPTLLADERGLFLDQFAPEPSTARVAYVAGVFKNRNEPDDFRSMPIRLAGPDASPMTITPGGQSPSWAPGGKALFFLQAVVGGWQPYRSDLTGPPQPAAAIVFDQAADWRRPPARFSPDGHFVAGGRHEQLAIVDCGDGSIREFPKVSGRLERIAWSPDAKWLYVRHHWSLPHGGFTYDLALSVDDGRMVPLNNRLGLPTPPNLNGIVTIAAGGWTPGSGHRLLLLEQTAVPSPDAPRVPSDQPRGDKVIETRWILRDVDTATSTYVVDLPPENEQFQPSWFFIAPDGRRVGIDNHLWGLKAPL